MLPLGSMLLRCVLSDPSFYCLRNDKLFWEGSSDILSGKDLGDRVTIFAILSVSQMHSKYPLQPCRSLMICSGVLPVHSLHLCKLRLTRLTLGRNSGLHVPATVVLDVWAQLSYSSWWLSRLEWISGGHLRATELWLIPVCTAREVRHVAPKSDSIVKGYESTPRYF